MGRRNEETTSWEAGDPSYDAVKHSVNIFLFSEQFAVAWDDVGGETAGLRSLFLEGGEVAEKGSMLALAAAGHFQRASTGRRSGQLGAEGTRS